MKIQQKSHLTKAGHNKPINVEEVIQLFSTLEKLGVGKAKHHIVYKHQLHKVHVVTISPDLPALANIVNQLREELRQKQNRMDDAVVSKEIKSLNTSKPTSNAFRSDRKELLECFNQTLLSSFDGTEDELLSLFEELL